MAQKGRKNAVIISVLLPVEVIAQIDARVEHLIQVSKCPPINRSEWIKRAIARDFDHDARCCLPRRKRQSTRSIEPLASQPGCAVTRAHGVSPERAA